MAQVWAAVLYASTLQMTQAALFLKGIWQGTRLIAGSESSPENFHEEA